MSRVGLKKISSRRFASEWITEKASSSRHPSKNPSATSEKPDT